MIDMSGWASAGDLFNGGARALTRAEVRALLEEGRECGRELRQRMRGAPLVGHLFTTGSDLCRTCGVLARGPGALRPCPGYMAGP